MKRTIISVGVLTAALAGCSASGNLTGQKSTVQQGAGTSTAPKAATKAKVGDSLHVTGPNGLDASVALVSVTGAAKGAGDLAETPKNGTFAVADILITVAAGDYSYNALYFKFQVADGTSYDFLAGNGSSSGFDPFLSSGTLHAGQKTRGKIAFDVPAAHGTIQLSDPLGGVVGEWTV